MKNLNLPSAVVAVCLLALSVLAVHSQKIDPAEIVAKHRASIGTPDALAAVKNQLVLTSTQFTFNGAANVIEGKALILSAGDKNLSGECSLRRTAIHKTVLDTTARTPVSVNRPRAAARFWGEFLYNNRIILREGLLGGTLSSSWPLLAADIRGDEDQIRGGIKKIDDKELIVLSYRPEKQQRPNDKVVFRSH